MYIQLGTALDKSGNPATVLTTGKMATGTSPRRLVPLAATKKSMTKAYLALACELACLAALLAFLTATLYAGISAMETSPELKVAPTEFRVDLILYYGYVILLALAIFAIACYIVTLLWFGLIKGDYNKLCTWINVNLVLLATLGIFLVYYVYQEGIRGCVSLLLLWAMSYRIAMITVALDYLESTTTVKNKAAVPTIDKIKDPAARDTQRNAFLAKLVGLHKAISGTNRICTDKKDCICIKCTAGAAAAGAVPTQVTVVGEKGTKLIPGPVAVGKSGVGKQ